MNKENRKMAQQRRAEERKKRERKRKIRRFLSYFIPSAAVLALVAVLIFDSVRNSQEVSAEEETSQEASAEDTSGDTSGDTTEDTSGDASGDTTEDTANDAADDTSEDTSEGTADDTSDSQENTGELSTDTSLTVADGDTVNIDYVGTVGGVEFDGGSTNGTGTDLVIGSGSYIDDFEDQLIGAHPGDKVQVEVTFPDDYGSQDLAGKDAVFAVTINGIYQ